MCWGEEGLPPLTEEEALVSSEQFMGCLIYDCPRMPCTLSHTAQEVLRRGSWPGQNTVHTSWLEFTSGKITRGCKLQCCIPILEDFKEAFS